MKRTVISLILLIFATTTLCAKTDQSVARKIVRETYHRPRWQVIEGDTVQVVDLLPVYVFNRPIDSRRYARLIRNVKVVYPIAKEANQLLAQIEDELANIDSKFKQMEYVKKKEKEIQKKYEPIIRKMSFSQGKILIKLIDRETSRTSYTLLKEIRGGFSAFIWQGVARIFGANLKDGYDKDGEDKMIEQIIILYEAGVL